MSVPLGGRRVRMPQQRGEPLSLSLEDMAVFLPTASVSELAAETQQVRCFPFCHQRVPGPESPVDVRRAASTKALKSAGSYRYRCTKIQKVRRFALTILSPIYRSMSAPFRCVISRPFYPV